MAVVDTQTIEQRLRLGEDSRTEFKAVIGGRFEPQKIAKEIVAFANSRGGQLFLGVKDDGTPAGVGTVQDADTLMQRIVQVCQQNIHPSLWCAVSKAEVQGKLLLVVDVAGFSPSRPYRTDHVYYIRDASVSREATREELLRLLQSQNAYFDEASIEGATADELDIAAVDAFLRSLYDEEPATPTRRLKYLQALKCLDANATPTVAGLLLFGHAPADRFPDARISAVRFPGNGISGDFADRQEIGGRLLDQLDGAHVFLSRHVPAPSRIEGMQRVELGIPDVVLREALLNAITHRDYRAASQVRVFVFDDRVEVINPGGLLNHLTLDSIRLGGISQRRNPIIASLLARARRRESLGIGVPEMIRHMRSRGLPDPLFELQGGHFRVVLRTAPGASGEQA